MSHIDRTADIANEGPGFDLVFEVTLAPHGNWHTDICVRFQLGESVVEVTGEPYSDTGREHRRIAERFEDELPSLQVEVSILGGIYDRSVRDLASLSLPVDFAGYDFFLPAGGMPWFMAVFGRDALIASYEALPFVPSLARGTLRVLAALQAHDFDDRNDAEPGKIPHELRLGRLAITGQPFTPYYGTVDATLLFLILLSEYWRWTQDGAICHELRGNALAAIRWIERFGDADADGFIEYRSRSRQGGRNQCWKDWGIPCASPMAASESLRLPSVKLRVTPTMPACVLQK